MEIDIDKEEKCSNSNHLKKIIKDLFCRDCISFLCAKCLIDKHRSHDVVDVDVLYEELNEDSKRLKLELEQKVQCKLKIKSKTEDIFKNEIDNHYNKQIELVDQHFREFHDLLHIKAVEIKRELKSFYDENLEQVALNISKLDSEINFSQDLVTKISNLSNNQSDFNSNYLSILVENKENNSNNVNSNNNSTNGINLEKYYSLKLSQNYIKKITNSIVKYTPLSKNSIENSSFTVFRYHKYLGLYRIVSNSGDNSITKLIGVNGLNLPPKEYNNCIYQYGFFNSYNSSLILFDQFNKYYFVQLNDNNNYNNNNNGQGKPQLEFKTGLSGIGDGTRCLSTIFDGIESIYIFGGYNNESDINLDTIYKFSLKTREIKKMPCKLLIESCCYNLTLDGTDIYLIGGYETKENIYLNRIDKYNYQLNTIEFFIDLEAQLGIYQVESGHYIPKYKCFYILTKNSAFYKVDKETKKSSKVSSPFTDERKTNSSKFYFNSEDDELYLIASSEKSIYKYSIPDNIWSPLLNNTFDTAIHFGDFITIHFS